MKTMKLEIGPGTVVDVPCFCGMPIVGQVQPHHSLIITDEYGYAKLVIEKKHFPGTKPLMEAVYEKHRDWFNCGDKCCLTIYGVGAGGRVVFGCAVFEGDPTATNPLERRQHLLVEPRKRVCPWDKSDD